MFSRRVPPVSEPNAWSRLLDARRAAGAPVLDWSESNPTRTGLSPLAEAAAILASVGPLAYEPHPRGAAAARAAVAAALDLDGRRPAGGRIDPEAILLTASTSEAYGLLFKLLANPGDVVLAPAPSYPLVEPLARAEGLGVRTYPLRHDGEWHLDRAAFAAALPGARAVVLIEPNHPTGSCLDAADRAFVSAEATRQDIAIIADEVFGDFPLPRADVPLPTWLGRTEGLTFVLGGLSKRCGLPHLKLGWIVAGGPARECRGAMDGLEWLADLSLSVGGPVQAALPALLELRHAFRARVRERMTAHLDRLDAFVRAHPECSRLPAAGGWCAMLRLPATHTDEAWALALLERGVAVHPGHFYDVAAGEFLVPSLVAAPDACAAGLTALDTLLRER